MGGEVVTVKVEQGGRDRGDGRACHDGEPYGVGTLIMPGGVVERNRTFRSLGFARATLPLSRLMTTMDGRCG
jgi:hypothetical protein